jgi:hypothetical protein
MKRAVGGNNPYLWPKTIGFHTQGALDQVLRHLREDKVWCVTEKYDGSNVCLSTDGWIASRHKIIGERGMETCKFQGLTLLKVHLEALFKDMESLKDKLKLEHFNGVEFELLLYGELLLRGTGNSAKDVYKYREKNRDPGDFFCFGIGLVLPENVQLPVVFQNGMLNREGGKTCFVVPLNLYLTELLTEFDIPHIEICAVETLSDILADDKWFRNIAEKKLEGYVLSGTNGEGLLKLKGVETTLDNEKHRDRIVQVVELLKKLNL